MWLDVAEVDERGGGELGEGALKGVELWSQVLITAEVGEHLLSDAAGAGFADALHEIPVGALATDDSAEEHVVWMVPLLEPARQ